MFIFFLMFIFLKKTQNIYFFFLMNFMKKTFIKKNIEMVFLKNWYKMFIFFSIFSLLLINYLILGNPFQIFYFTIIICFFSWFLSIYKNFSFFKIIFNKKTIFLPIIFLDFVSNFARVISLTIRLHLNIFFGLIILLIIYYLKKNNLFFYFINIFELFVVLFQSYILSFLSMMYLN